MTSLQGEAAVGPLQRLTDLRRAKPHNSLGSHAFEPHLLSHPLNPSLSAVGGQLQAALPSDLIAAQEQFVAEGAVDVRY